MVRDRVGGARLDRDPLLMNELADVLFAYIPKLRTVNFIGSLFSINSHNGMKI